MGIIRINQFPNGSETLSDDDLFLIMDNPLSDQVTKSINTADLRKNIINTPTSGITYGFRDNNLVDITSPANLQIRRGTEAEISGIIPLEAEPLWGTDNKSLYIGDGSTYGGIPIHPIKFYKFTGLPGYGSGSWFSISLSPQNSYWELDLYAILDLYQEGNSTATFSFASSSGIVSPIGSIKYIDSTNSVQNFSLVNAFTSNVVCTVNTDQEILKINGIFEVPVPTGILMFTENNDNHNRGANICYLVLRRLR